MKDLKSRAQGLLKKVSGGRISPSYKDKGDPSRWSHIMYPMDLFSNVNSTQHFVTFYINTINNTGFKSHANVKIENAPRIGGSQPVIQRAGSNSFRRNASKEGVSGAYRRSGEAISIYCPEQIQVSYGATWNTAELGAAGTALNAYSNLDNQSFTQASKTFADFVGRKAGDLASGAVQGITGMNVNDAKEIATGRLSNPWVEVLFKGSANREIPLSFKFSPRNEKETKIAREIIRRFKFHAAPEFLDSKQASAYMVPPSIFDIQFGVGGIDASQNISYSENKWMNKFSSCALSSINVNYTSTGEYSVMKNDSPTEITVDLTFVELETLSKAQFEYVSDNAPTF